MDSVNIHNEKIFDDSWLEKEDRSNLIKHIKHLYDTKFGWADEALMKAMIKYHYNLTVGKMNKDDYLKEKATTGSIDDFLDNLG